MYQINLDEYAATIAYHFEKAEDINNAIEYYKKAAVYAQKNFLNSSALHYLNKLLSYEKFLSKTDFMEFIINKIEVLKTIGQWKQAENLSYEALSFAETNHFLNQKADLLSGIGWLEYMKRNFEKSIENLDKAGKIYQLTKNDKGLSETIGNKAIILMRSQNFTEAEKLFKKKIEWDKAHSNLKGLSSAYLNYAVYLGNTNQLQKSKEMYNNGLEISNQLQDKVTQSTALGNLALIYMKENNLQKAKGYFTKTLQLALEIGDKRNLIYIYGHFGNYYYIQKKYIKAKDFFEKQLSAAIEIDFKHGIITALVNKKNVEKDNGNFLKAIELSDKALQLAKNSKNMTDVLEMLSHKGNLFYLFEYYNEACEIYKETLQTAQKVENSFFEYTSLYSLGKIFEETNLWEQSLDYFFKAKAIGDEKNFAILKNKCVEGIVSVNYQMGHYQQVIDFLYEEKKKKDSAPKFPPIVDFIQLKSEFMLENNDNAKGLILEKMLKVILIIEDITNRFEANFDIILLANYTNKHDVYQAEKGKLHQEIEEYLQKDLLFYVR
jgi:tetratricopeptide (TPR) repeat protein